MPVPTSYMAPTIVILLSSSKRLRTLDFTRIFSTDRSTLFFATSFTNGRFEELRMAGSLGSTVSFTEALIFESRLVRFPNSTLSQAPFTAPHEV